MDSKRTVVHYCSTWLPLTQTWLYHQVRHLPGRWDSQVVCEDKSNLESFEVPNIHCLLDLPKGKAFFDRAARDLGLCRHLDFLVRTARETGAVLLHSHFGHIGWGNLAAAKKLGLKHVVTFYGLDVNCLPRIHPWKSRYPQLFREIDQVLCEGSHMKWAIANLGCPPEKIAVHHLGVDVDNIAFQPRSRKQGEPLRILIAASFREKKGIPYALEAVGRLLRDSPGLSVEVTVIGDAGEEKRSQSEKQKILKTIGDWGLMEKVKLLGYQPYPALFEQAYRHHLFLSPSVTASDGDTEGGAPVGIIEMAATGMPIVSTTHCDIPSIVLDGESGLLVPERDALALARSLKTLYDRPQRWAAMGKAGREHVLREYDARTQGRRLGEIYDRVTKD